MLLCLYIAQKIWIQCLYSCPIAGGGHWPVKEGVQGMGFYAYSETICQVGFATAPATQPY